MKKTKLQIIKDNDPYYYILPPSNEVGILNAMQQYSDQNTKPLIDALNTISQHSYSGSAENTIIDIKKIASEALKLFSK